jgi:hypothetical protein
LVALAVAGSAAGLVAGCGSSGPKLAPVQYQTPDLAAVRFVRAPDRATFVVEATIACTEAKAAVKRLGPVAHDEAQGNYLSAVNPILASEATAFQLIGSPPGDVGAAAVVAGMQAVSEDVIAEAASNNGNAGLIPSVRGLLATSRFFADLPALNAAASAYGLSACVVN